MIGGTQKARVCNQKTERGAEKIPPNLGQLTLGSRMIYGDTWRDFARAEAPAFHRR